MSMMRRAALVGNRHALRQARISIGPGSLVGGRLCKREYGLARGPTAC